MQAVAEKAVADHLRELDKQLRSRGRNLPDYDENKNNPNGINPISNYLQAALIAVEPQTGHIKAMVGGRDFYITRQKINFFNRSVNAYRQPGSAFKPIVFAGLLDLPPLITPATIVRDEAWSIDVGTRRRWRPRNYGLRYYGDITARRILEKSINIATARMMWETPIEENEKPAGLNRTLAMAKRLGIDTELPAYPSVALGAGGLPPIELTSAYAVFANGGKRRKPIGIHYVEDQYGVALIENQSPVEQVLDPGVAYLMTHLMKGVVDHGTGVGARLMGLTRPAAGKTGTTDNFTDAWFVGYIENLAAGVWVGFNDPKRKTTFPGARGALPIWARFMIEGARGPIKDFEKPSNIVLRSIDKNTGMLKYQGKCPEEDIIKEAFIVGYEPKMLCNAHQ
jgi:membrane carboxypeptidase/penicillin-binding protein